MGARRFADSLKKAVSMFEPIGRRATHGFMALLAAVCLPMAAPAATINIILSDMDVTYLGNTSGGAIFDAMGGFAGGSLAEATADTISTAVFELDDVIQGVLVNNPGDGDDISTDLRITNVGATIAKNTFHPSLGSTGNVFGIDVFTDTGFNVRLAVDDVSLFLSNNVLFFTGEATIVDQMLPFGMPAFSTAQPVVFSYTATMPAVNGALTDVSMAGGSGALTISGVAIPEPAMASLATVACLGGGLFLRRRRAA